MIPDKCLRVLENLNYADIALAINLLDIEWVDVANVDVYSAEKKAFQVMNDAYFSFAEKCVVGEEGEILPENTKPEFFTYGSHGFIVQFSPGNGVHDWNVCMNFSISDADSLELC